MAVRNESSFPINMIMSSRGNNSNPFRKELSFEATAASSVGKQNATIVFIQWSRIIQHKVLGSFLK